jgi:8-oxo-dGTP diphosphatase
VDLIIAQGGGVVLIRRRNPPLGWALPGGFVDEGETVESAALREAMEETGLRVTLRELFYVYSDPKRDSRQHNLSVVFTATATGTPKGADDAEEAKVFSLSELPDLVFDHTRILSDYQHYLATGERPDPQEGR